MTALTGLLDGETAEALKGLYGVDSSPAAPAETEGPNSWDDYDDEAGAASYCDSCGSELTEAELPIDAKAEELLCGECDRRNHSHAVGRFRSTSDDLELD